MHTHYISVRREGQMAAFLWDRLCPAVFLRIIWQVDVSNLKHSGMSSPLPRTHTQEVSMHILTHTHTRKMRHKHSQILKGMNKYLISLMITTSRLLLVAFDTNSNNRSKLFCILSSRYDSQRQEGLKLKYWIFDKGMTAKTKILVTNKFYLSKFPTAAFGPFTQTDAKDWEELLWHFFNIFNIHFLIALHNKSIN